MEERLNKIEEKYNQLLIELENQETVKDIEKYKKISKEKKDIEELVFKYKNYKNIKEEQYILKQETDKTLIELIKEELKKLEQQQEDLQEEIEKLLVPKDENDEKNIILEIRGAAGGDEANLFAGDLFDMYSAYSNNMSWKVEIINEAKGTSGGFSQIEAIIKGKNVYSKLKYENGVHRVQRVPDTETQGRVHTSTATVAILPERENVDIELKETDLKIDVYRSGGAGGQSVNTTDSAVRITHLPTGIIVTCQNERSQIKNKETAIKVLKNKLYEQKKQEVEQKEGQDRKTKIGTGDRSEKIRTYNYPQNRITDHRINFSIMDLDKVMLGHLDVLINELTQEDLKRKMLNENIL